MRGLVLGAASLLAWTLAHGAAGAWEAARYHDVSVPPRGAPSAVATRALVPSITLSYTVVQRPKARPGGSVTLRAEYVVTAPGGVLQVREVRAIRFEGQQVARLERVVSRPGGVTTSECELRVPADAAPGWYTVQTLVEPKVATVFITPQEASAAFYVDSSAASPGASRVDGRRRVKLWTEKPHYTIGEALTVFFESETDGYLTLLNVGTSGRLTILYPNRFVPRNEVKAHRTYAVPDAHQPFKLRLEGPAGVELVYALLTTTPTTFTVPSGTKDVLPAANEGADRLMRRFNEAVKKVPLDQQASAAIEIEVGPER